jgi:hypothetical protein
VYHVVQGEGLRTSYAFAPRITVMIGEEGSLRYGSIGLVRMRPPTASGPVQRERIHDRPGVRLPVELVEATQHRLAMSPHRGRVSTTRPGAAGGRAAGDLRRQCGRAGLPATSSHRQKSRTSARVARSHDTPSAHKNRNQRNRSSPYERAVAADRPAACRSRRNASTASTGTPSGSTSTNGAHGSPEVTSRPTAGTTTEARSRAGSISSMAQPTTTGKNGH